MYTLNKSQGCHGESSIQEKEEDTLHQQTKVKFEVELLWYWKSDISQNGQETPGKLWKVVLEKDVEDQFDRSCETWRSVTWSQRGEEYSTDRQNKEG